MIETTIQTTNSTTIPPRIELRPCLQGKVLLVIDGFQHALAESEVETLMLLLAAYADLTNASRGYGIRIPTRKDKRA